MTEQIFQTDAYCHRFRATIIEHVDGGVVLDRTAFYPGGGGQGHDVGELRTADTTYSVEKCKKVGDKIVHLLAGDFPKIGIEVVGEIDWQRRYRLMRTHTAMHILCGVVNRDYGAQVTGGSMDPLKGRMDFEFETMRQELVAKIEAAINKEVEAARDVEVMILPREEAFQIPDLIRTKINLLPKGITNVRTVHIKGLDLQADGGTHVKNTEEVGPIRVTNYKSKGKINKRIYIEIDD